MTGSNPLPLQFTPFSKEDLQDDKLAVVNQQMQQIVNAINQGNGAANKVVLPFGADVRGATVSNIGEPQAATDAVSQGHVATNYGAPTLGPKLDIGGKNALKGLTGLYQLVTKSQPAVGRIPATNYAGGQSFTLFGMIIKLGHTATFTGTQAVAFTAGFPGGIMGAFAVDDYTSGTQRQMSVNQSTVTTAGFTIISSGAGNGAYWLSVGW